MIFQTGKMPNSANNCFAKGILVLSLCFCSISDEAFNLAGSQRVIRSRSPAAAHASGPASSQWGSLQFVTEGAHSDGPHYHKDRGGGVVTHDCVSVWRLWWPCCGAGLQSRGVGAGFCGYRGRTATLWRKWWLPLSVVIKLARTVLLPEPHWHKDSSSHTKLKVITAYINQACRKTNTKSGNSLSVSQTPMAVYGLHFAVIYLHSALGINFTQLVRNVLDSWHLPYYGTMTINWLFQYSKPASHHTVGVTLHHLYTSFFLQATSRLFSY